MLAVLHTASGVVHAQVHAVGKPVSRAGDAVWDSDALLHRTAELTIGYSGAELANLLNEAAILMARFPVLIHECWHILIMNSAVVFVSHALCLIHVSAKHDGFPFRVFCNTSDRNPKASMCYLI